MYERVKNCDRRACQILVEQKDGPADDREEQPDRQGSDRLLRRVAGLARNADAARNARQMDYQRRQEYVTGQHQESVYRVGDVTQNQFDFIDHGGSRRLCGANRGETVTGITLCSTARCRL